MFKQEDLTYFSIYIIKLDLSYKVKTSDSRPKYIWLVFPWFLTILRNNKHLENLELRIWSQLLIIHRNLMPINLTLVFAPLTQLVTGYSILKALIR